MIVLLLTCCKSIEHAVTLEHAVTFAEVYVCLIMRAKVESVKLLSRWGGGGGGGGTLCSTCCVSHASHE